MDQSKYIITFKSGADPGFQVRGGALKKIAPSGGRREHFWGISCEKSRFYAKRSYFFQLRREARKVLGVFRVENHEFTPKNHIFSNFRGGAHRVHPPPPPPPPPLDPPLYQARFQMFWDSKILLNCCSRESSSLISGQISSTLRGRHGRDRMIVGL
jgi:hypothetical protein